MSAPARFKQVDVARALKGARDAGMRIGRVEIDPTGKIVMLSESVAPIARANPWDKELEQ